VLPCWEGADAGSPSRADHSNKPGTDGDSPTRTDGDPQPALARGTTITPGAGRPGWACGIAGEERCLPPGPCPGVGVARAGT
jgi:hypothetical protein